MAKITNAERMARASGLDPETFRDALRDSDFPWYKPGDDWTAELGSLEHDAMRTVLLLVLLKRQKVTGPKQTRPS
ncbi:hypothetical protein ACVOMV_16610 [Mesorhizobium atlanticum]